MLIYIKIKFRNYKAWLYQLLKIMTIGLFQKYKSLKEINSIGVVLKESKS